MDLFDYADDLRYGEIHLKADPAIGLRAIVAIHNLNRGPAIGGCRFIEYDSSDAALTDAMRLARGMSYKAAISNLPHGGGKAVIVRPKGLTEAQRIEIFEAYGAFVGSLGGRYLTCEDSGTTVGDMDVIKAQTDHVLGYDPEVGGSGDPSPLTALGVRRGIQAAAKHRWGRDDLVGLKIAIQGVGHVGYYLARELHAQGAQLIVTDINQAAVERCMAEFDAHTVERDAIYGVECDVFAPCALGAIINDATIPQLRCEVVAGAANNQLAEDRHGLVLRERGILYSPDYAINAGGLINVAHELRGYDADGAREDVEAIYATMLEIFERADRVGRSTNLVADAIAEERIWG